MNELREEQDGFSMLEVLTVICILSILMIFALPNYIQWRNDAVYKEAALGMFNQLREGRSLAISSNVEYRLTFDMSPGRYKMERGNRSSGSTSWTQVFAWVNIPESVTIASWTGSDCDGTADVQVVFTPNGACSSAVVLCVLTSEGLQKFKINITSAASGRVTLEKQS